MLIAILALALNLSSHHAIGQKDEVHGRFLFNVGLSFQDDLDSGQVPEAVRNGFADRNILLSGKAYAAARAPGVRWMIIDVGINQAYVVEKEDGRLNIYHHRMNFGDRTTLKLEILVDEHLATHEPILLTVKMTNISENEILKVFMPIRIRGKCRITGTNWTKVEPKPQDSVMVGGRTHLMMPGEIFYRTFDLLDYFHIGKREGIYTIEYKYDLRELRKNDSGQTYAVNSGALTAKRTVEVTNSMPEDERKAMNAFRPGIKRHLRAQALGSIGHLRRASLERRLANQHVSSLIFYRQESNAIAEGYRTVLEEYPTSSYAELALFFLAQYYQDVWLLDEASQTYEQFIARYPSSRLVGIARYNQKDVQLRAVEEQKFLLELERISTQGG